jgi:hypothetical protein
VIRLPSLPVPQPGATLDDLGGADAAPLFVDRAEAAGANLSLGVEDGPAIAEICRRLDGIPLAIELAAARVMALGPREIAAHLDERFRLLTGGQRGAIERHHTLRAAIDWSYSLLGERDQAVLNHLGVFPASFDVSAAQAVAAAGGIEGWDALDALTSLVAKSMLNAVRSTAGSTRYQMLESLRHYARERLEATGAAEETLCCHARHYSAAAAEISAGLRGPDAILWRGRLDADLDNFRAAVTWALASTVEEDGELALVIVGELSAALLGAMTSLFAGVVYQQVVERAGRSASPYASLAMAAAATNALYQGDFPQVRELSREAMRSVRMSQYPGPVLVLSLNFAEPESLAVELTEALQILDEVGADLWEYAELHAVAAVMAGLFGNLSLAGHEAALAIEHSRRIGNPTLMGLALYGFALASWQSDPIAAQTALEEQVQILRSVGGSVVLARALALLAHVRAGDGDPTGALTALREG